MVQARRKSNKPAAAGKLKIKWVRSGTGCPEEQRAVVRGLVRRSWPVKILGEGELKVKLTVAAHAFSASARQKIEQAGGRVELVSRAAPPAHTTTGEPSRA